MDETDARETGVGVTFISLALVSVSISCLSKWEKVQNEAIVRRQRQDQEIILDLSQRRTILRAFYLASGTLRATLVEL